jgi:hypothetical protein
MQEACPLKVLFSDSLQTTGITLYFVHLKIYVAEIKALFCVELLNTLSKSYTKFETLFTLSRQTTDITFALTNFCAIAA